ncbi:hypothetical protein AAG663_03780 [Bacillus licheniformis]
MGNRKKELQWIDDVLKRHPDRKAILAFHEFLLVSGSRSPIGEKIFEQIIKRNPNVIAVLSGHYHSSNLKVDKLDDNGDGKPDRKVYQMLADYQGGPEGGQGYLRILHVDPKHDTIHVKTYSPYLDDYNFYDPHQFGPKDEFNIKTDLKPRKKKVKTDYFELNVFSNKEIGKAKTVKKRKDGFRDVERFAAEYNLFLVRRSFRSIRRQQQVSNVEIDDKRRWHEILFNRSNSRGGLGPEAIVGEPPAGRDDFKERDKPPNC